MKAFAKISAVLGLVALFSATAVIGQVMADTPQMTTSTHVKTTKVKSYTKTLKSGKMVKVKGYTKKVKAPKMVKVAGYTKTLKSGKTIKVKGYTRKAPAKKTSTM